MSQLEEIVKKYENYLSKGIIDYEKFNQYAITHHSSAIEGATLTLLETQLLLSEDVTANKPFLHHLMIKDHFNALILVLEEAKNKRNLSLDFIQSTNAEVMKNTGVIINTILGNYDISKGEFRKSSVVAGNHIFVDAKKVVPMTENLVKEVNLKLNQKMTLKEKYELSFDAHFNLVSIHPFGDGNGRTSRLLMNYIQSVLEIPLALIYQDEKLNYIKALEETIKKEDISIFRRFMFNQLERFLKEEMEKFESEKKSIKINKGLSFIF